MYVFLWFEVSLVNVISCYIRLCVWFCIISVHFPTANVSSHSRVHEDEHSRDRDRDLTDDMDPSELRHLLLREYLSLRICHYARHEYPVHRNCALNLLWPGLRFWSESISCKILKKLTFIFYA